MQSLYTELLSLLGWMHGKYYRYPDYWCRVNWKKKSLKTMIREMFQKHEEHNTLVEALLLLDMDADKRASS